MKVIVAHPGKQHSFQLASALKKSGNLYKYITSVYYGPHSITKLITNTLNQKNKKKAKSRNCDYLKGELIQFYEVLGLLVLLFHRIKPLNKVYRYLDALLTKIFGKKVARYAIKDKVDIVIMFDAAAAKYCFEYLKEKSSKIIRILDVSIATRQYMRKTYEDDMKLTKDTSLREGEAELWNEPLMTYFYDEIHLAQYYLVASKVVKESLIYIGVDEVKIFMVPYGVDLNKFSFRKKEKPSKPLELIFVGWVNYRKGIHHLLEVASRFDENSVVVNLVGEVDKKSSIYVKHANKKNINFLGFVTRDILAKQYQSADVFVFPTLGEGFGLVVLEAQGCGLPVICSSKAGGNDAIIDGYNGFVFEAGNDDQLYESIKWFIDNPDEYEKMSIQSRNIAETYTWEQYDQNITVVIDKIFKDNLIEDLVSTQ